MAAGSRRVVFPKKRQFRFERLFILLCITCFVQKTLSMDDDNNNVFYRQGELEPVTPTEVFVNDCCKSLLAQPVLGDQRISQTEYANFLIDYCRQQQGACPPSNNGNADNIDSSTTSSFDSLNPNLQVLFVDTACPSGSNGDASLCFFDYDAEPVGAEFGLIANPENLETIDERVKSLCTTSFLILLEEGPAWFVVYPPTPYPSTSPSMMPVVVTSVPTFSPTVSPTTMTPTTGTSTTTGTSSSSPSHVDDSSIFTTNSPSTSSSSSFSTPQNNNDKNVTDGGDHQQKSVEADSDNDDGSEGEGGGIKTATILGIISALAVTAFCVAVMYSGGFKEPDFDTNKPMGASQQQQQQQQRQLAKTTTTTTTRRSRGYRHARQQNETTFRGDEEYMDDYSIDDDDDNNNNNNSSALARHLGHAQTRLDPNIPPFHPDNIETEKQRRPKYAERINPFNLLNPSSNSWQPQG